MILIVNPEQSRELEARDYDEDIYRFEIIVEVDGWSWKYLKGAPRGQTNAEFLLRDLIPMVHRRLPATRGLVDTNDSGNDTTNF